MEIVKEILIDTYTLALPIILGYIVWLLQKQRKDKDANTKGTMMLLRVQLIEYHDKYVELGYIPSYALENFVELYECYKTLGGNGMVKRMYEEVQGLPIGKKEGERYDTGMVEGSSDKGY